MDKDWSVGLVIQCWDTYYVTSGTYSNEIFSIKLGKKTLNWSYPCQVDSIKKTKQPSRFDILSELDG